MQVNFFLGDLPFKKSSLTFTDIDKFNNYASLKDLLVSFWWTHSALSPNGAVPLGAQLSFIGYICYSIFLLRIICSCLHPSFAAAGANGDIDMHTFAASDMIFVVVICSFRSSKGTTNGTQMIADYCKWNKQFRFFCDIFWWLFMGNAVADDHKWIQS